MPKELHPYGVLLRPIITEKSGIVKYQDLVDGKTPSFYKKTPAPVCAQVINRASQPR